MATELTDEEEQGFRSWYSAISTDNDLPDDPDEPMDDNGEKVVPNHRKFFKRIMNEPDFAEGVQNMIKHSQRNLDTGHEVFKDGGVSTVYSTSMGDENGIEHIVPTVWRGEILEDGEEIMGNARSSGLKWPTASSHEEANETASWLHQLVMKQKPKTPVGERVLRLGY